MPKGVTARNLASSGCSAWQSQITTGIGNSCHIVLSFAKGGGHDHSFQLHGGKDMEHLHTCVNHAALRSNALNGGQSVVES